MDNNMYEAHKQWASRPADECFSSISSLNDFCCSVKDRSSQEYLSMRDIAIETDDNDEEILLINKKTGDESILTNHAFKQLCYNAEAPPDYLSRVPASLAATNLRHCWREKIREDNKQVITLQYKQSSGSYLMRAMTSQVYDRVWNAQITSLLNELDPDKIGPPPSHSTNGTGTGLYASTHDMFAFLVAKENYLTISGAELVRGVYFSNNEVGSGSLTMCAFLCDYVCGNHIIWGVKDALKLSVRHVGTSANKMLAEAYPYILAYSLHDSTAARQEQTIKAAQAKLLGKDKGAVINYLYEKRFASQKLASAAFHSAQRRHDEYGNCDPRSVWGIICGLTAEAKSIDYYDEREVIELSATKLLETVSVAA